MLPARLRRLYVARDGDRDGAAAAERLRLTAEAQDCEVFDLVPQAGDFNADLRLWGLAELRRRVLDGLSREDAVRFGAC